MKRNVSLGVLLLLALVLGMCAPLCAAQSDQPAAPPAEQIAPQKVNINTADSAQIEQLPGIGPAIAREIVQYRETNGPFKAVEDLKLVRGIGDKKLESIKDKVTVE